MKDRFLKFAIKMQNMMTEDEGKVRVCPGSCPNCSGYNYRNGHRGNQYRSSIRRHQH